MLIDQMETVLQEQNDPRMLGNWDVFDQYAPNNNEGLYEKFMNGEILIDDLGWINPTDAESEPIK